MKPQKGRAISKCNEVSRKLGLARDAIQANEPEAALDQLNKVAAQRPLGAEVRSKILTLTGEAREAQGQTSNAVQMYSVAVDATADDRYAWLRPEIALLINYLGSADFQGAFDFAKTIGDRAVLEENTFRNDLKTLYNSLTSGQSVVVAKRPHRASVVYSRLGKLFLDAGDIVSAQYFFALTANVNPVGGCKARLGKAQILNLEGDFSQAATAALDAMTRGRFQAKTLSGWPLYINSLARSGGGVVIPPAVDELLTVKPTVRDRARLLIAIEARKAKLPWWSDNIEQWVEDAKITSPGIAVELIKLVISDRAPSVIENKTEILSELGGLTLARQEWINYVRRKIAQDIILQVPVDYENYVSEGHNRFPVDQKFSIPRAIATTAIANSAFTAAITIIEAALTGVATGSENWGNLLLLKAKAYRQQGDLISAADCYQDLCDSPTLLKAVRVAAAISWINCSEGNQQEIAFPESVIPLLAGVAESSQDPFVLFDLADRVTSSADSVKNLKDQLVLKGKAEAENIVMSTPSAEFAATRFYRAVRGLSYHRPEAAISFWEGLPSAKKALIAGSPSWYGKAMCRMVQAYCLDGQLTKAVSLANSVSSDASTPWAIATRCRASLALGYIYNDQLGNAFSIFEDIITDGEVDESHCYAHYWLGLRSAVSGNLTSAHSSMNQVYRILGKNPLLPWKRDLTGAAKLVTGASTVGQFNSLMSLNSDDSAVVQLQGNCNLIYTYLA